MRQQIIVEQPTIRIHENPFGDSRAVSRVRTAGERNFDDRSSKDNDVPINYRNVINSVFLLHPTSKN